MLFRNTIASCSLKPTQFTLQPWRKKWKKTKTTRWTRSAMFRTSSPGWSIRRDTAPNPRRRWWQSEYIQISSLKSFSKFKLFLQQLVTRAGVTFRNELRIVLLSSKSPLFARTLSLSLQKCLLTWLKHYSIGLNSGEYDMLYIGMILRAWYWSFTFFSLWTPS